MINIVCNVNQPTNLKWSKTVGNNDKSDGNIPGVVEDRVEQVAEVEDIALFNGSSTGG